MPADKNHISQVKHNIHFLESFYDNYSFNDWSITVAFYIVVHIVESAIFKAEKISYLGNKLDISHADQLAQEIRKANLELPKNYTTSNFSPHVLRSLIVSQNFKEISNCYNVLYTNSRTSRYKKYSWTKMDVDFLVKPSINEIIKWSNKRFKTDFVISWKKK